MVEDLKPGLKSRQMYLIIFLEWEEMVTNVEAIKIKAVHVGFGWGKLEWQNAGREEYCGFRAAMQKTPVSLQNAVCLFFNGVIYFLGVTVYLEAFLVVSVCCKHTCGLRRSLCYKKVMCILNPKSKSYCDQ